MLETEHTLTLEKFQYTLDVQIDSRRAAKYFVACPVKDCTHVLCRAHITLDDIRDFKLDMLAHLTVDHHQVRVPDAD